MEEYKKLVDRITPHEKKFKNFLIAFFSGGIIGLISDVIVSLSSIEVMLLVWIVISSLLTGFGVFDDIVEKFKMGVIIPITGFSHSVASSTIEYKREGLITGMGANYFKLAGSVILYGIVSAAILALIKEGLCLL